MPASRPKVLVCIATYREPGDVDAIRAEIARSASDFELLLLLRERDSKSPPGRTSAGARDHVVTVDNAIGDGGAHLMGIRYAYDQGYDLLVTFDARSGRSPSEIRSLVVASERSDITIGAFKADARRDDNVFRDTLAKVESALGEKVLGERHAMSEAFRVYRLGNLSREMWNRVHSTDRAFFVESLCVAHQNGATIRDVEVGSEHPRDSATVAELQRSIRQLVTLFAAAKANPAQFRVATEGPEVDKDLVDPQGWDTYWERKKKKSALTYEVVAAIYRNLILRERLNAWIRATFPEGAKLLHAGCGSGQVDVELHDYARITAVDISVPALELYKLENPKAYAVKHASILRLPFADGTFDGAYNLGVVEHFEKPELTRIFRELHRVIKPGGKIVVFWPHARATSVAVLGSVHWLLNDVLKKGVVLHPPEVSLVHSRNEAAALFDSGGFDLDSYEFGARDFFVQVVAVGTRRPSISASREPSQAASA